MDSFLDFDSMKSFFDDPSAGSSMFIDFVPSDTKIDGQDDTNSIQSDLHSNILPEVEEWGQQKPRLGDEMRTISPVVTSTCDTFDREQNAGSIAVFDAVITGGVMTTNESSRQETSYNDLIAGADSIIGDGPVVSCRTTKEEDDISVCTPCFVFPRSIYDDGMKNKEADEEENCGKKEQNEIEADEVEEGEFCETIERTITNTNQLDVDDDDDDEGDEEEDEDDEEEDDLPKNKQWSDYDFDGCSEEEDNDAGVTKGPIRSKNEIKVLPPVPPIDVTLQPEHEMLSVGVVLSIIGNQVIVEGAEKHSPLGEGSILWITGKRSPLGIVDEIFGPVKNPYYMVRFNSETEIPQGIEAGTLISFVAEFASHVLHDKNLYQKGYDASGKNDEEESEEAEFSDDEKEAEFKKMMKMSKRKNNGRQRNNGIQENGFQAKFSDGDWRNSKTTSMAKRQTPLSTNQNRQNFSPMKEASRSSDNYFSAPDQSINGEASLIRPPYQPTRVQLPLPRSESVQGVFSSSNNTPWPPTSDHLLHPSHMPVFNGAPSLQLPNQYLGLLPNTVLSGGQPEFLPRSTLLPFPGAAVPNCLGQPMLVVGLQLQPTLQPSLNSAIGGDTILSGQWPTDQNCNSLQQITFSGNLQQQQIAVPASMQQQIAVPGNMQQQIAVPVNMQQQIAVPVNMQQQIAVPGNMQQQIAVPGNMQHQITVPNNTQQQITVLSNMQQQVRVFGNIPDNTQQQFTVSGNMQQQQQFTVSGNMQQQQQQIIVPGNMQQQRQQLMTVTGNMQQKQQMTVAGNIQQQVAFFGNRQQQLEVPPGNGHLQQQQHVAFQGNRAQQMPTPGNWNMLQQTTAAGNMSASVQFTATAQGNGSRVPANQHGSIQFGPPPPGVSFQPPVGAGNNQSAASSCGRKFLH